MLKVTNLFIDNQSINDFSIAENGHYVISGKYAKSFCALMTGQTANEKYQGFVVAKNINVLTLNDITKPFFRQNVYVLNTSSFERVEPSLLPIQVENGVSFAIANGYSFCVADLSNSSSGVIDAYIEIVENFKNQIVILSILPSESPSSLLTCQSFVYSMIEDKIDKIPSASFETVSNSSDISLKSYFAIFKKYIVHFLFVLLFAICSCVGWFLYGFYKSPYNYYAAAEAQMSESQIQARIAAGEPMSWDFTPGWITALFVSIFLTLVCLYGIYSFRKVITRSKSYTKDYETRTQFLMFVLIMLFAFFLTGVGILVFYQLFKTLPGFLYGNTDSFVMLLVSVLLMMLMIFLPSKLLFFRKKENKR